MVGTCLEQRRVQVSEFVRCRCLLAHRDVLSTGVVVCAPTMQRQRLGVLQSPAEARELGHDGTVSASRQSAGPVAGEGNSEVEVGFK